MHTTPSKYYCNAIISFNHILASVLLANYFVKLLDSFDILPHGDPKLRNLTN